MTQTTQTTRVVTRGGLGVRVIQTARLEVTAGPDRGTRSEVVRPVWRVGTHASNDLVLGDDTVSKHHLELALVDDGWRVRDLGSSNRTLLGDVAIGDVVVHRDTTLRLGATTLKLRVGTGETELAAAETTRFGDAVGRSPVMRELFAQLAIVAVSDASLLFEGETGVGKEILAEAVHRESARRDAPFITVDCAALTGDLFESELFGHVKGAFTGAVQEHVGLVEAAHGGTLFLDEVGELPAAQQAKLLGVLERRQVRRVGSDEVRAVDVRVVAATNRDLLRAINDGSFRADLYYRLAVVCLRVPPLRERTEDIPLLVEQLAGGAALSAVTVAELAAQPWPGNVRELRNAVERALLELDAVSASPAGAPRGPLFAGRAAALVRFESEYFEKVLATTRGNLSAACRLTGLDRRYLYRILRRLGLRTS